MRVLDTPHNLSLIFCFWNRQVFFHITTVQLLAVEFLFERIIWTNILESVTGVLE